MATPISPLASVISTLAGALVPYPRLARVPVEVVWSTPVKDTDPPPSSSYEEGIFETWTVCVPSAGLASPQRTTVFWLDPCIPPSLVIATPL